MINIVFDVQQKDASTLFISHIKQLKTVVCTIKPDFPTKVFLVRLNIYTQGTSGATCSAAH